MTERIETLILEHARAIRSALDADGEKLSHIELRLAAMEQTLSNIDALSGSHRETLTALTRRIERIESRLAPHDTE